MNQHPEHCPACGRALKDFRHYPRLRILGFERLPVPEAVDHTSAAASEKWLARRRREPESDVVHDEGINTTPANAQACETAEVSAYFSQLEGLVGKEIEPKHLLPHWPADGLFKRMYRIADTGIYLGINDADSPTPDERIADLEVYCEGPNMGSAGGPTMQCLGSVAQVRYQGLLKPGFSADQSPRS